MYRAEKDMRDAFPEDTVLTLDDVGECNSALYPANIYNKNIVQAELRKEYPPNPENTLENNTPLLSDLSKVSFTVQYTSCPMPVPSQSGVDFCYLYLDAKSPTGVTWRTERTIPYHPYTTQKDECLR